MPELKMSWRTDRPAEGFSTTYLPAHPGLPVRTFLPTDYQPKYPYPLVVLFHAAGETEDHAARLAPALSRRNYVCLGLRGPQPHGPRPDGRPAFGWAADQSRIEDYVAAATGHAGGAYNLHPDRTYLVGVGDGAEVACRLGFAAPDRFAGVIALNGKLPAGRLPRLGGLRVFVGHGTSDPVVSFARIQRDCARLTAAGGTVRLTGYPTTRRLLPEMLRDVNGWIMGGLTAEADAPVAD